MALPTIPNLQGVHAAAITPRGKAGDINFGATFELLDYLSAARVSAIALFTAAGEYPALTIADRARLTYLAVKRSRVPVLAGVGSATFDHSLELAREARAAGAAALILPPPLHYRYDQEEILEFYAQFARQAGSGLTIFLDGDLDPDTSCKLLTTGLFAALTADDRLFTQSRNAGLGVLSAAACAAPELAMALDAAIRAEDSARIATLEAMHRELLDWLDQFPAPLGVKSAVAVRGIDTGPLPVPLSPRKQELLTRFRDWFRNFLPATRKLSTHG